MESRKVTRLEKQNWIFDQKLETFGRWGHFWRNFFRIARNLETQKLQKIGTNGLTFSLLQIKSWKTVPIRCSEYMVHGGLGAKFSSFRSFSTCSRISSRTPRALAKSTVWRAFSRRFEPASFEAFSKIGEVYRKGQKRADFRLNFGRFYVRLGPKPLVIDS